MKRVLSLILLVFFLSASVTFGEPPKKKRIPILPDECREAKFTCVMKISDGVAYYCQKSVKQRYKNAKKEYRAVTSRKCRKRLPVFYEKDTTNSEE